jgi:hypothetical protein
MAIDLITGHQSVSHISADQIATINNAMMDNFGANKVMRLVGGELTADGLTITISEGYWRVNGFDMEIQEGETLYIDPTTIGLSRIDDIYVEILQDIPTGAQRAEIYIALGEPSATPTAPDEPTAPYLNTDILLQIIKLARVTVAEGAMIMEDYSVAYNIVTPEDLAEVQTAVDTAENHATTALNMIRSTSSDAYSPSKAYKVGEHCIYNNVLYKCITACSAASWSTNKNCFTKTTLTTAVTELNSDLADLSAISSKISITLTGGFTGGSGSYVRYGHIVFVEFACYYNGALAANTTYKPFEGLPVPSRAFTYIMPALTVNEPPSRISVDNSGRITLNPTNVISANTYVAGTFMYLV